MSTSGGAGGWALPGYELQAYVAASKRGDLWRGRDLVTDQQVALKRVFGGGDGASVERWRAHAELLRSLESPYLVQIRDVVRHDGDVVLVLDWAVGGSLADLLARRPTLTVGEIVTVAVPVASALGAAHDRGAVHGALTPAEIVFTADGMPLLAGLWPSPTSAEMAGDVTALAALCRQMLTGHPPHDPNDDPTHDPTARVADLPGWLPAGPTAPSSAAGRLLTLLDDVSRGNRSREPDAVAFAAALRRCAPPAPVRLLPVAQDRVRSPQLPSAREVSPPGPGEKCGPAHAAPSQGRVPRVRAAAVVRPVAVGIFMALLLVLAAAVGWLSGRGAPATGSSLTGPASSVARARPAAQAVGIRSFAGRSGGDWAAVLDGLDRARAEAFATANVTELRQIYAPGSPPLVADRASLERFVAAGEVVRGVRHRIASVTVEATGSSTVALRVAETLASYQVLDQSGHVAQRLAAGTPSAVQVTLVRTAAGWRISAISPG